MSTFPSTASAGIAGSPAWQRVRVRQGVGSRALVDRLDEIQIRRVVTLVLTHCVLAEVLSIHPLFSALYAWGVVIWAASVASTKPANKAWGAMSYLVAAEILWRMTRAWNAPIPVFWEFGKYAAIACLLAMSRRGRGGIPWGPVAYLILMSASVPLTLTLPFGQARQLISFNLSGPFTLALASIAAWRTVDAERPGLRDYSMVVYPIAGVAWLCLRAVLGGVQFGTESSVLASGGYGPNQISTMLGFGLLIAFLIASAPNVRPRISLAFMVLAGWYAFQGLLTFSRGGMVAAALAAAPVVLYNARTSRNRRARTVTFVLLALVGIAAAAWVADKVSGGALSNRYGEFDTTGRTELAKADIEIAQMHPLLGVGPGMTTQLHGELAGRWAAPHTEYTRVIAEHGVIGVIAVLLLTIWMFLYVRQSGRSPAVFLAAALCLWGMLTMAHSAMRLASSGVAFGLGLAVLPTNRALGFRRVGGISRPLPNAPSRPTGKPFHRPRPSAPGRSRPMTPVAGTR